MNNTEWQLLKSILLKVSFMYTFVNISDSKEFNSGNIKLLCCFITVYNTMKWYNIWSINNMYYNHYFKIYMKYNQYVSNKSRFFSAFWSTLKTVQSLSRVWLFPIPWTAAGNEIVNIYKNPNIKIFKNSCQIINASLIFVQ